MAPIPFALALALESYRAYLADMDFVSSENRRMERMARASVQRYLERNRRAFARFDPARAA